MRHTINLVPRAFPFEIELGFQREKPWERGCHTIARNTADGGYTKKFVACNVAEVARDSTAAILRALNFGVDTRCNSAIARNIARNIAPCIRTFRKIISWFVTVSVWVYKGGKSHFAFLSAMDINVLLLYLILAEFFDFDNLSSQLQATKHMISNGQIHTCTRREQQQHNERSIEE